MSVCVLIKPSGVVCAWFIRYVPPTSTRTVYLIIFQVLFFMFYIMAMHRFFINDIESFIERLKRAAYEKMYHNKKGQAFVEFAFAENDVVK